MISVGSRDGRKGTSLGLDMEETELEEGEALSYHEENEDSTIDPDIALSYIEEKLQSVLGHFQKDFEGGVSAENLGAKFGGYGSFLPTYQRSPSWSHTRSPAEVRNYDSPRSPRKLHTEDQRQTLFASSSASPSAKSHTTSGKPVSVGHSLKGNGYLQSRHADEASLKRGANKKSVNDQRTLKVRIKVGFENFPTQKNSEIYSGLGLVVSPSSSLDESPTTSEGQCGKLLDVPEESPTSILQIMTSFTSELLLSPLSEDLIHLPGKRNTGGKCETKLDKTSKSSGVLVNGSLSNRSSQKVLEKKKLMSNEKDNDVYVDSIYQKNNNNMDSIVSPLKKEKEMDIDVFGCEELVSNALKLPLLCTSQHIVANPEKDKSTATTFLKDGLKGETFSPFIEKEHLESEAAQSFGRVEKLGGRLSSSIKASESKEVSIVSLIAAIPQEDAPKAERSHALDQPESNASKGIKALSAAESSDPLKQIVVQKGGSVTEEGLESVLEKSSKGGKKKQKVSHSKVSEGAQMAKDELMVESSLTPKSGKNSHTNNGYIPKSESLDLQKDHERPGDRYKEFFGDLEFEDDDNESISGEMTSSGKLKYPQPGGKRSSGKDHGTSKEKQMSRNSERLVPQENYPRPPSHLAAPHENGQGSEAPMGMIPLVKEDWVECDKCKQWRLLPLDTNPKSLPDKWLCRMLTWLPGMNRCSVPEEETTNALRALYHPVPSVPAPTSMNLNIQPYNSTVILVGMGSFDGRRPPQEHQNLVPSATISGKKKHGSAKVANSADLDGSTHSSNSRMKNLGASGKLSKLNSRDNSPSVDASGDERMRKLSIAFEKCNDAETEKISLVSSSGKGASVKMKNKREPDMEGSRSSKRMKSEEFHVDDENWASENCGPSSKTGRRSSSLSNNTSGNDRRRSDIHKDLNGEAKKNALSGMNAEVHFPCTSGDALPFPGKCDDEDSRKRKEKEHHSSRIHTELVSNSGRHRLHSGDFTEELRDFDLRKEKKARVSKSGGKPTSGSKASVGTERKGRSNKDQHDGQYVKNSQAVDYQKSDMGSVPPSVAANSSSSKVSGSHRNKTNGQEGKASPVESVSSSPLRFPNADKVSSRKNLDGEDDFHDSGSLTAVNPRRLSGGDDGVGFTGLVKKDAVNANAHANDVYNDQLCQSNQYATAEVKINNDQSQYSGSHSKKSGKGLSHSKEKASASGYLDKVNIKASDSRNNFMNHVHLHDEKSKSRRNKSDEKFSTPTKGEILVSKKDTAAGTSSEGSKGCSQWKFVHDGKDADRTQDKKHDHQEEHDNEKLPKKSNQTEVHGNGKSHSLPPLARVQTETGVPSVSGSQKENGVKGLAVDAYDNGDALKAPHQKKKSDSLNGQPLRHPTPNSHKVRDVEAPSPLRRDSTSHAANNALKEAKDLKHMADRLKNSGSTESNGLYFQAALKFLYGASLLESGSSEATKHNDLMHSIHIYSSTAKLCEFCAHEYEKAKDMAAASLAYKCVEVAYMRVVYSSHGTASRDRNELQNALQIAPPGESPSSSASDVDNLNHQATADKVASTKVVGSPQVSGSHVISSRNRSSLLRVLNLTQDINLAMEASRKSRTAFTAATSRLGETMHKESMYSLKKALDFNFQDVEGLLRLVKIAMEAISR